MTILWTEPVINGAAILSYTVYILESDEQSYSLELSYCDGSLSSIVNALQCTIPVAVLKAAPFNLPWGTNVHAKLYATNIQGDSIMSNPGSGAIITTNPDPPIDLVENYSLRTPTTLGLTWTKAPFIGGAVIDDYRVSFAVLGGSFSVLVSGLLTPDYKAVDLTSGVIYQFKVQSRNSYDYSSYSETITLLCAFKPEAPAAPVTSRTTNQAVI